MFSKWDRDSEGALSGRELWDMIAGHRVAMDPFGVSVAGVDVGHRVMEGWC